MSYRLVRTALSAACLLLPAVAVAGDLIPVEDFARHAQIFSPTLSPDGQYVSARVDTDDGKSHALYIYKVSDMNQPVSIIRMPKYELPLSVTWVSGTRLVVEKGKQLGSLDKPYSTGEILATDVDGKNQDYLYGYDSGKYGSRAGTRGRDRGFGSVDGTPDRANGHFYMGAYDWESPNVSAIYDVNAMKNTRALLGDISVPNMSFLVNQEGKARFAFGTNDDYDYVLYRRDGNTWNPLKQAGTKLVPRAYSADNQRIYANYSDDGGPAQLIEQDENGGNRAVLAKDSFSSVGAMQWTPIPMEPFAAILGTGIPKAIYLKPDAPSAKLHMALSKAFPGQFVNFINYTEDGSQLLFSLSSDRNPGGYYLIDTKTNKVTKLFAAEPWIDPAKMAERRPVHFKASDGMELEAILTLPKGARESNLPLVLLPHGGPHGISDRWFYDDDAQFLASRGYLVLQVNYRGSGGRGDGFHDAGYLKWGTRVQQDLIDGVKWAISEQYADANRVCVYGGSFGGYSAMMTVIRAPGMFKCAVGYAGIYDLAMMYKKGDIKGSKFGRSYLTTAVGKDDADLAANSPDKLADQINVPVFLVHGEDDQRAPFAQYKAMKAALDAAHKPYETLTKPNEGHGFYDEKNNIEFYTKLEQFLDKYIGPQAPVATPQVSQN